MSRHDDDPAERGRVYSRIAPVILEFSELHATKGRRDFHVEDLRKFVRARVPGEIAPDSPGRILRELRQVGRLDYIIVNRRQSHYRFCGD